MLPALCAYYFDLSQIAKAGVLTSNRCFARFLTADIVRLSSAGTLGSFTSRASSQCNRKRKELDTCVALWGISSAACPAQGPDRLRFGRRYQRVPGLGRFASGAATNLR